MENQVSPKLNSTRWLARLRMGIISTAGLVVLVGFFQNCDRWQGGIDSPKSIYGKKVLNQLSLLSENQKESLCHSAANYVCRVLKVDPSSLTRNLAEMKCMDHPAFPRRICVQLEIIERPTLGEEDCRLCQPGREYSCLNAALRTRTDVEYWTYSPSLEEALTKSLLGCQAAMSYEPPDQW
jgi:hypothetical protein